MKSLVNGFVGVLLATAVYTFPVQAMENDLLDPSDIFEIKAGGKATRPDRTTGANILHAEGIQGQTIDGRPLLVAVIDSGFYPEYTRSLKEKGLIHPDAFSKNFILDPEQNLEDVDLPQVWRDIVSLQCKLAFIENKKDRSAAAIDSLSQIKSKISDLEQLRETKMHHYMMNMHKKSTGKTIREHFLYLIQKQNEWCIELSKRLSENDKMLEGVLKSEQYRILHEKKILIACGTDPNQTMINGYNNSHGSAVLEALHQTAPKVRFLPIDLQFQLMTDLEDSNISTFDKAIEKAIEYNADVINISSFMAFTPELVQVCKKAVEKGIPIITAAGNESTKGALVHLDQDGQDLYNALDGEGMRFVGGVRYGKTGKEKLTNTTRIPTPETREHFLCAAGKHLPIRSRVADPDQLGSGTSYATPVIAGGYVLLKQYALDRGYKVSPEGLLNIMYQSGRDVFFQGAMYKSLDLAKAKKKLDELHYGSTAEGLEAFKVYCSQLLRDLINL